MSAKHDTIKSFSYAINGITTAFKREPNFKIQIGVGIIAITMGFLLHITKIEWLILLIIVCLVLIMEMINTVLEALVNIVSPQIQEEAKVAKDVAAAAVLFTSLFAVVIGIIIFLPKFL